MIKNSFRKTPDLFPLLNVRIIDGDTLEASILLAFGQTVSKRIRLKGWWAAELHTIFHADAEKAALRLRDFCEGKALWLFSQSCRLDRYGRVIGSLVFEERIVSPREVIGDLQLTEAEHKRRSDSHRLAREGGTAHQQIPGGMTTADLQSKRALGHPAAKSDWENINGAGLGGF
jgi:hypothetical protein